MLQTKLLEVVSGVHVDQDKSGNLEKILQELIANIENLEPNLRVKI